MQSSRDSSLWRSLAVAFGDGLAFGVGVKLTQAAGRQLTAPLAKAPPASAPPPSDPGPLVGRLEQIEQNLKRIERVERAPVAGSNAVDQKVLEAIINALEARLAEHSTQVERQMADLQAKLTIELRSLDQQDHSLAKRVTDDIDALQQQMVGLHREFGEAVARIVAEQVDSHVQARADALEQSIPARIALAVEVAVEPRLASVRREIQASLATVVAEQVTSQVQAHAATLEESLRRRIPSAVEVAVGAAVQTAIGAAVPTAVESCLPAALRSNLAPLEQLLRVEVERKDREIAELRERLADSDANVLELIQGIGQICRQAAGRIAPPAERGSAHGVDRLKPVAPEIASSMGSPERGSTHSEPSIPAVSPLPGQPTDSSQPPDVEPQPSSLLESGAGLESQDDTPLPGFAQAQKPNRLWRVPLVSSLVLATGLLLMRHFL